jgi:hypothetical protein
MIDFYIALPYNEFEPKNKWRYTIAPTIEECINKAAELGLTVGKVVKVLAVITEKKLADL